MNYSYYFSEAVLDDKDISYWKKARILKSYLDALGLDYYFVSAPKEIFFLYYSSSESAPEIKQRIAVNKTEYCCDTIIDNIAEPDDFDSCFYAEIITDEFNKNSEKLKLKFNREDCEITLNTSFLPNEPFSESSFQYYYHAFNNLIVKPKQAVFEKILPRFQ